MKSKPALLPLVCATLLLAPVAWAEGGAGDKTPGAGPASLSRSTDGRLTFNMPVVPFGTFLKTITEKGQMNLVTSADLAKKPISVYLKDVTAHEALEAICDAYDLFIDRSGASGVAVIRPLDTQFIVLQHADAEAVQALLPAFIGEGGQVSYDKVNNVVAVKGSQRVVARVEEMVRRIDRSPRQVLIQSTLAELSDDVSRQLGIRWEPSGFLRGAVRKTEFPFRTDWVTVDEDPDAWTFGFVNFQDFFVQLQALERDSQVNILANPRIAALHGKEAQINITTNTVIGTEVTRESEGLDVVTEEPLYAEVGVTLKTTPWIHEDDRITLEVEPSVSSAQRSAFFEEAVDTFHRSARTTVMLDSGETIAIGGLLQKETIETKNTVPYISRIPLLGRLFTHRDVSDEKRDLVVFLSPRLMGEQDAAEAAAEKKRRERAID